MVPESMFKLDLDSTKPGVERERPIETARRVVVVVDVVDVDVVCVRE